MTPDREQVRAILAFYLDAGVDVPMAECPANRLADALPAAAGTSVPGETAGPAPAPRDAAALSTRALGPRTPELLPRADVPAPASPEAAIMAAREAAKRAATLEELHAILGSFEGCALRNTASRLVFAAGNPQSRVMFVGEAPGRDEDIEGLPFVGRSGKLLDLMMGAIGLDRSSAYIANIIPWRPPGNRTPTPQESAICLPFIRRQIELANPDLLVCMGQPATQALLGTTEGITRTRGRVLKYHTGTREIRAIATFHPAYLLRQPLQKRLAWRDFMAIKKALANSQGGADG